MASNKATTSIDRLLSTVLTIAAVVMAIAFVHREFFAGHRGASALTAPSQHYDNWRQWLRQGVLVGDSAAPVTILEFGDLECEGCKAFYELAVRPLKLEFGRSVAFGFIHFPLRSHRFATLAAQASECANAQGRFEEFTDLVFAKQNSLGVKPWTSYAVDAGVADTLLFARCIGSSWSSWRVSANRAIGDSLGIHATPTVFVNGWRYPSPPTHQVLSQAIRKVLSGERLDANHPPR